MQEKSLLIELKHLFRALGSIELTNDEIVEALPENLVIESGINVAEEIEKASKHEKIGFDSELKTHDLYKLINKNKDIKIAKSR